MSGVKVDKYGGEYGANAVGVIRVEANVADEQTVTVGSTVFEFDRSANGVATSGATAVTAHADDTPANATDALVDAINAAKPSGVVAVGFDDNEIALFTKGPTSETVALAETMSGSNNEVEAAVNGGSVGSRQAGVARVPTSTEAGTGNMHFAFPFDPSGAIVQVRVTATGAAKAWDGDVNIVAASGEIPAYVTVNNDGSTDWAATDTVTILAFE